MSEMHEVERGAGEGTGGRASRGAGFPTLDLTSAVAVIHEAGLKGGTEFTVPALAQYAGHSTHNSGPFKMKMAAFKDWALLTSRDGRVRLTDVGLDVVRSNDPATDQQLLRRVFDGCEIFKRFFEDQAKGTTLRRDMLARIAVVDYKVAPRAQDKFVATLIESAVAAGLATTDGEAVVFVSPLATPSHQTSSLDGPANLDPVAGVPEPAKLASTTEPFATVATATLAPMLLRQVWPTAAGEVVLEVRSRTPLSAAAFGLVGETVSAAAALAESISESTKSAGAPARQSGPDEAAQDNA